jgi:hypothetical protein
MGFAEMFRSPWKKYKKEDELKHYLIGRIIGDASAAALGTTAMEIGGGLALTGGGAIAGAGTAAYGGVVSLVAAADIGWCIRKLAELGMKETAVWNAVKYATSGEGNGPSANNGEASKHGGDAHDAAINNRVSELQNLEKTTKNVKNIRKNQVQVDVKGNRTGNNRPDLQYDQFNKKTGKWEHVCHEYDNIPANSINHGKEIKKNDPNAVVVQTILNQ